jgi:hypothetical protein
MSDLKIDVINSSEYHLTNENGIFMGKITYENWLKTKASITTQYGEFYDLTTKGFWKTHVEVEIGGDLYATMRQNWRGQAVIDIAENDIERDYLVKSKGFWKSYYVLLNREEKEVLKLIPQSKWFNKTTLWIEIDPTYASIVNETLILLAVYCVNAIRKQKRAAQTAAS